jgi:signal transduction histidine kinase
VGAAVSLRSGRIACARFRANPFPPTVAPTGLLVNNRREAPQAPGAVLELAHDENHLTFEYVGLHFADPERIRYRVRLAGVEPAWRDVGAARSVTYPGLPAGTFTLEAMAANASGVWSEPVTLARLTILPAWWRTWWAYTGYALLLAAGLWWMRRYEMGRIALRNRVALERAEADKLRDLDRMKSTFFEDMSHEFRTPLAIIQGQLQSLLDRPDEQGSTKLRMAVRNARRMQHLTDQILDLARIEAGSVALEATVADVVSFLRSLVAAFESLAASRRIHLSF